MSFLRRQLNNKTLKQFSGESYFGLVVAFYAHLSIECMYYACVLVCVYLVIACLAKFAPHSYAKIS
jgi:hypothetical protein